MAGEIRGLLILIRVFNCRIIFYLTGVCGFLDCGLSFRICDAAAIAPSGLMSQIWRSSRISFA